MNASFLTSLLSEIPSEGVTVIDATISKKDYVAIDLSKNNTDLNQFDIASSKAWEQYINSYLQHKNAKVAFGGYLEHRNLYTRSAYFTKQEPEHQRKIHLGLDLWCEAGTTVLAAFNGRIHSFKNNTNFGDYGPTIIVEHKIKGTIFYTLYGHLSLESLSNLKIGQDIKQGETIATLGKAEVNGDYAPHLHFQIIKDLQGNLGDYPGVCSANDLAFYTENTVNPELVLSLV
ncbi:peptidoglycan DD-metalloendopeptidase family protein [Lacinutrix salivirga]